MNNTTRRGFLGGAGAGALATGAAALAPGAFAGTPAREPVVALVSPGASGEVTLLVGEREVVVRDPDLAGRILRAGGR
jgi:hypothetical protein